MWLGDRMGPAARPIQGSLQVPAEGMVSPSQVTGLYFIFIFMENQTFSLFEQALGSSDSLLPHSCMVAQGRGQSRSG